MATLEQLAHWALAIFLQVFIKEEAASCAFIDGLKERDAKQHLHVGSERSVNEAFSQVLMLEYTEATDGPPIKLRRTRYKNSIAI